MKMFQRLAIATAFAGLGIAPVNAAVITTLFNTGVDSAGAATTGHAADLHWTLTGGTAYTGGTNGDFPIGPWVAETPVSRWLTPAAAAAAGVPAVDYTYSTTFSLTGYKFATAALSGRFAADDSVVSILLNGVSISSAPGGYTSFTGFSTSSGFVAGVNTLTFVTHNTGGPAGVRVEVGGTGEVPEPATWALMLAGFGMVGFAARRRRIATVAA